MGFFLVLSLMIGFKSYAYKESIIKKCDVRLQNPEDSKIIDMKIEIRSDKKGLLNALIQQTIDGMHSSSSELVNVVNGSIRPGLTLDEDYTDLNQTESFILHAIALQDPIFEGKYSAGLDLSKVRFVKAYIIGEQTDMGSTTVVEAQDANGNILGNFLGGFVVSPCM